MNSVYVTTRQLPLHRDPHALNLLRRRLRDAGVRICLGLSPRTQEHVDRIIAHNIAQRALSDRFNFWRGMNMFMASLITIAFVTYIYTK
jgi:hypothetical protein